MSMVLQLALSSNGERGCESQAIPKTTHTINDTNVTKLGLSREVPIPLVELSCE